MSKSGDIVSRPTVEVGGGFSLTNHFGEPVTERFWPDKHLLIFFGFTHCKVVCPRALAKLERVIALLGDDAARLQPLYITVDPARDAPEVMRAFLAAYPHFLGLTGDKVQIDQVRTAYRVFAEKRAAEDGDYDMPHSALTYLVGPGGRLAAHYVDALEPEVVAGRISAHLRSVS